MTSEEVPGTYENGIIFKEKRKESMVDSILKNIKPVEKEAIDEAIELTEFGEGFE
ncbi:MAG: hypothetical protein HXS54_13110 [Theionarchaea archaeon]|nr:hypothetical protein [Theionarchaea archaeon]